MHELRALFCACCATALTPAIAQADDISRDCRGVLRFGWYGVLLDESDVGPAAGQPLGDHPIDEVRWAAYHERCRKASDTLQAAVDKRIAGGLARDAAAVQTCQADARLTLAELDSAADELLGEPVTREQRSAILRRAWVRSKKFAQRDYLHAPLCMDTGLWLAGRQAVGDPAATAELFHEEVSAQLSARALQLRTEFASQRMEDWRRWGPLAPGDPGHAKALATAADYRRVASWRKCQIEWVDWAAARIAHGGDPLAAAILKAEFLAQENPDFLGALQFYRTFLANVSPDEALDPAAFSAWRLAAIDEHNQLAARFIEDSLAAIAASRSTWPPSEAGLPRIELAERLGESLSTMEARHGQELLGMLKPDAQARRAEVERLAAGRNDQEWNGWRLALDMSRQLITAERVEPKPPDDKSAADGQPAPGDTGK